MVNVGVLQENKEEHGCAAYRCSDTLKWAEQQEVAQLDASSCEFAVCKPTWCILLPTVLGRVLHLQDLTNAKPAGEREGGHGSTVRSSRARCERTLNES